MRLTTNVLSSRSEALGVVQAAQRRQPDLNPNSPAPKPPRLDSVGIAGGRPTLTAAQLGVLLAVACGKTSMPLRGVSAGAPGGRPGLSKATPCYFSGSVANRAPASMPSRCGTKANLPHPNRLLAFAQAGAGEGTGNVGNSALDDAVAAVSSPAKGQSRKAYHSQPWTW